MGCCTSSNGVRWPKQLPSQTTDWSYQQARSPWEPKAVERQPYEGKNLTDEVFLRRPGEIAGAQIQLDKCTNCDVFLCDVLDSAFVDDCVDCRIFIGPTTGSIFFRDCKNCKVVVAAQQIRMRNCKNFDMLVYCPGKPIIESSSKIAVGCFDFYFFGLQHMFDKCKLSAYNNRWSDLYDFTAGDRMHYSFLDPNVKAKDLLKPMSQFMPDFVSPEEEAQSVHEWVIPPTWGLRDLPGRQPGQPSSGRQSDSFVLFLPGHSSLAAAFLRTLAHSHPEWMMVQSREHRLQIPQAQRFLALLPTPSQTVVDTLLSGPSVLLHLYGTGGPSVIRQCVHKAAEEYDGGTLTSSESALIEGGEADPPGTLVAPSPETASMLASTLGELIRGEM
eukprot:NODE_1620_length_1275_cov_101.087979_g1605_i0.p1 GENE.NODE_1620_length_1275_cov_101.087979_g1605_i0~~NODE_1620_length_1275_cov_101.087979_g1605_i0.p1  ORF type:complete len:387 (+),score=46.57 NODE_1620_length_1275_cov_101.087979_g1605_i0:79-1239(+)